MQSPSKLIDYALANRPVFNMSQNSFDPSIFLQFLSKNYYNDYLKDFDLDKYDIKNVANKFISLCDNR